MSACDLRDDAVGHAFSALEPDEDRALLAHLPHCAVCRRALAEAREVVAALGAAVPAVDPPPDLGRRVLAAARAEPGPPARPVPHRSASAPAPATPDADGTPAPSVRRRRLLTVVGGLAAAVVLGVGLVVAGAVLPTQEGRSDDPTAVLGQQADRIVDDARSRDPGLRSAVLRTQTGEPAAVVLDPGDVAAPIRMVPLALPGAGPSGDYVLWATGLPGNVPVAVAVLDPDDGLTRPVETTPGPASPPAPAPRGWAVSVEPGGSVPARPSTVVAVGLAAT
ncbi:hypothetical protein Acsp06_28750 [Actinomycetospora sp. NBRC 106375]|uniref:anti-sigma factor domain-containing protein n=1 Tax=Actinomycetospora sp. NBRC 106375 TaxID=3032207 RepID=UPI0024A06C26|nr:anti-sigma factor [Actinomycetospora sp. NBRC 106375]GLZ46690.1 hypothetical protein Acsp06_28750 [Actinomycetospora sp. NBRC 106375]